MDREVTVWDGVRWVTQRFEPIGAEYTSGRDPNLPDPLGGGFDYLSSSDVQWIYEGIRNGWSLDTIVQVWGFWLPLSLAITLFALGFIAYFIVRVFQIRKEEQSHFQHHAHPVAHEDVPRTKLRWRRIQDQINSDDEHQWRLAILESDILLNDLLDVLGYKGETMADKMKQIDVSNFNSIDYAWEGHKIRNQIAHEGTAYQINSREARRVVKLYERVFREFKFID